MDKNLINKADEKMDCETCGAKRKSPDPVPFIVHEGDMARLERTIKRLWILLLVTLVLLVGSNIAWIVYESQFIEESVTQEVSTEEGDAYVAGIGDVNYGEDKTDG